MKEDLIMQKKGFSAGFVAGFTTSELFHKLAKVVKETLKDMKISIEDNTICETKPGCYTETAQLDPVIEEPETDEFLKKA